MLNIKGFALASGHSKIHLVREANFFIGRITTCCHYGEVIERACVNLIKKDGPEKNRKHVI